MTQSDAELEAVVDSPRHDLVERNIAHVRSAFGRIGVRFDEADGGNRILAFAAAMTAEGPLRDALLAIEAMETPGANATVKRMAAKAPEALDTPVAQYLRQKDDEIQSNPF